MQPLIKGALKDINDGKVVTRRLQHLIPHKLAMLNLEINLGSSGVPLTIRYRSADCARRGKLVVDAIFLLVCPPHILSKLLA